MSEIPESGFETAEEALEFIRELGFTLIGNNEVGPMEVYSFIPEEEEVDERPCGRTEGRCCGGKCG